MPFIRLSMSHQAIWRLIVIQLINKIFIHSRFPSFNFFLFLKRIQILVHYNQIFWIPYTYRMWENSLMETILVNIRYWPILKIFIISLFWFYLNFTFTCQIDKLNAIHSINNVAPSNMKIDRNKININGWGSINGTKFKFILSRYKLIE